MALLTSDVRLLTGVPLIAEWLTANKDWTALATGIQTIGKARADLKAQADVANDLVNDLTTTVTDTVLSGKPIPTTVTKMAGDALRKAQDAEAAWNIVGRVEQTLLQRQGGFPREHSDEILRFIQQTVTTSVATGRAAAKKLGNAATGEEAARAGAFPAWLELEAAQADYADAKTAHRHLVESTGDNEATRSIFWIFRNIPDLYPEWQSDSLLRTGQGRVRPWPADITGMAHFLWICRNTDAEPWAPSTDQVRAALASANPAAPVVLTNMRMQRTPRGTGLQVYARD